MPLYEYRCKQCGYRFEKIQSFSAEPETECPKCQGPLVRPLTAPAFQFKGSGWYVNDYAPKSASSTTESAPESKTAAADSAKTAPAGDSKPAASSPAPAPASAPDSGSAKPGSSS